MRRSGVIVRRVRRVVGSGIGVGDVKLFRMAKRSARFVWPSWFASPLNELVPKFWMTLSRSA